MINLEGAVTSLPRPSVVKRKVYPRTYAMSFDCLMGLGRLLAIARSYEDLRTYVKVSHLNLPHNVGGSFAKLRHWGLIESKDNKWRITPKGKKFVSKGLKVYKNVVLMAGEHVGFDGNKIGYKEMLKKTQKYNRKIKKEVLLSSIRK